MRKLDLEKLEREPLTKLAIQHYQDTQTLWLVPKWELTLKSRITIQMPLTGYETNDFVLIDDYGEVRDIEGNMIGTLCIAADDDLVIIPIDELINIIQNLKDGESVFFDCSRDSIGWTAQKHSIYDRTVLLIGWSGGGATACFDIKSDTVANEVADFIKYSIKEHYTDDKVYINPISSI